MLLSIRDLQAGYGRVQILWGVDLDVAEGEIVSLLGMNGAGKTTTLRTVSGVVRTWRGEVTLCGRKVVRENPEARAALGLGHVPEGRGVLAGLTVGQNLDLGATLRKDGAAAVQKDRAHLLDLFEPLAGRLGESAASLSGGQQQMLVIARALLARPRLLMIDELSFGLSPLLVGQLFDLIKQLRDEGTTFLLVEQNAGALAISDRTYVLSGGRTVLESASDQLVGSDRLVRSYLGEHPAPHATAARRVNPSTKENQ